MTLETAKRLVLEQDMYANKEAQVCSILVSVINTFFRATYVLLFKCYAVLFPIRFSKDNFISDLL
jgi:hypothetical protein